MVVPIMRLFPPTRWLAHPIRGLARTVVAGEHPGAGPVVDRVAIKMVRRVAAMPWLIAWGIVGLTLLFELGVLGRRFRRFSSLSGEVRAGHVQAWRGSKVGLFRDWVEFYERMLSFLWYSEPEPRQDVGAGPV